MSDINIISAVLVVVVAFLAGLEGILDQFQFHQPLVACTLIGLVTGHLEAGIILGGTLQMVALGWANIGAAVAPDAALASVAAAIIMVKGGDFTTKGITFAYSTAGLFLTMIVRTLSVALVHTADNAAKDGNFKAVERAHFTALLLQGLRIAVPAALLLAVPAQVVKDILGLMPDWLNGGMQVGGAMVVAVGYAMVINVMATREVWPFFAIGFAVAAISDLTLIALGTIELYPLGGFSNGELAKIFGVIGVALAFIYLNLSAKGGNGGGTVSGSGDPIGDILEDY